MQAPHDLLPERERQLQELLALFEVDPWRSAPGEADRLYSRTWRAVSRALQLRLRAWVGEVHFRNVHRYEDRQAAYPYIVYHAARVFRPTRTLFTYDPADPGCAAAATRLAGARVQRVLAPIEARLHGSGLHAAARRYAPVWHQDIRRAVATKPELSKVLAGLIAAESKVIGALLEMGSRKTRLAAWHFLKATERRTWEESPRVALIITATAKLYELDGPAMAGTVLATLGN